MSESEPWVQQDEIDKLIASGYVEIDLKGTEWWKTSNESSGTPHHTMYRWTAQGKEACFRYKYSTPMAWARAMRDGDVRHCVGCGKDLYHKPVGARHTKGPQVLKNRCVCIGCWNDGHGVLLDAKGEK